MAVPRSASGPGPSTTTARALRASLPADDGTPVLRLQRQIELLQMLHEETGQDGGDAALRCRLARAPQRRCRG